MRALAFRVDSGQAGHFPIARPRSVTFLSLQRARMSSRGLTTCKGCDSPMISGPKISPSSLSSIIATRGPSTEQISTAVCTHRKYGDEITTGNALVPSAAETSTINCMSSRVAVQRASSRPASVAGGSCGHVAASLVRDQGHEVHSQSARSACRTTAHCNTHRDRRCQERIIDRKFDIR